MRSTISATLVASLVCVLAGCTESSVISGESVTDPAAAADSLTGPERAAMIATVRARLRDRGVVPIPDPPPQRRELVELGRALAFDKILSGNRDVSCMTCHHSNLGTDDDRHLSMGVRATGLGDTRSGGVDIARNAPPLFNLHTMTHLFWDGRVMRRADGSIQTPAGAAVTSEIRATFALGPLSALPLFPVTSREEMRGYPGENELADIPDGDFQGIWRALMARLAANPTYVRMFQAAYPTTPFRRMNFGHAANAIAAFIATDFVANDSPWDQFIEGDDSALTDEQLIGAEVFSRTCINCHTNAAGTDDLFHNTMLAQFGPGAGDGPSGRDDFGREKVTRNAADRYEFRTTPLRNVELTAPYGHTGEINDLFDFLTHYVSPEQQLRDYVAEDYVQIDDRLEPSLLRNEEEIIAAARASGEFVRSNGSVQSPVFGHDMRPLFALMLAMTDPASRDMALTVPRSVPSALPVD